MADIETEIADALSGANLRAADEALDEARRILWTAALTGKTLASECPRARRVADLLSGVPLHAVVETMEGYRVRMWLEHIPGADRDAFKVH